MRILGTYSCYICEIIETVTDFEDYSMKNRTYRYMTEEPLYPFGYGLSYSNFEYDELYVPDKAKAGEEIVVGVTVSNTSCIAGEEVVQLYLTDDDASVPVPVRQLAAFKRVFLNPGESKRMSLTIPVEKFSLILIKIGVRLRVDILRFRLVEVSLFPRRNRM